MAQKIAYGTTIVQGRFGKGKSYSTILDIYNQILLGADDVIVISNNPYSFVDYFYSTFEDLVNICSILNLMVEATNSRYKELLKIRQRRIIIIIDEAHLYFDSRHYQTDQMDVLTSLLTQCRKRLIKFVMITQKPGNLDSRIRTICDFTVNLKSTSFWGWVFYTSYFYENPGDIAMINGNLSGTSSDEAIVTPEKRLEMQYLRGSTRFRPLSTGLSVLSYFDRAFLQLKKEEYVTLYVIGYPSPDVTIKPMDSYIDSQYYHDFINLMYYDNPPKFDDPKGVQVKPKKKRKREMTENEKSEKYDKPSYQRKSNNLITNIVSDV